MTGRGNRRHQYSDIPLDDEEAQELNPIEKYTEPSTTEQADSRLLHQHRRHKSRSSETGTDEYTAARRDFRRHYRGKGENARLLAEGSGAKIHVFVAAPPVWPRTSTEGLQTQYQVLGADAQGQLARYHDPRKQFWHLLGKILVRWACSVIISVAIVIAFYRYEKVKNLDTKARRWITAVTTGLYIALGLNLAASLRGMAVIVRWKLLARKEHQLEEVGISTEVGFVGPRNSSLVDRLYTRVGLHHQGFPVWRSHRQEAAMDRNDMFRLDSLQHCGKFPRAYQVLQSLTVITQIGCLSVALTGSAYYYDSAGAVYIHPGQVNITNWSTFSKPDAVSQSSISERLSAHSYGLFSAILESQSLTKPGTSDPNKPLDRPIELSPDGSWVYYFRERSTSLPTKSSRSINVRASCDFFPLISGQYGNSSTVVYLNNSSPHTLDAISDYGPRATTWINPRSDLPKNRAWSCGPRCASLAALTFLDPAAASSSDTTGGFYDCEVHISTVIGGNDPAHEVPDAVAEIAAGAIAWEGYSLGPDQWEYVRYPPESPWSSSNPGINDDAGTMAQLASRFAIGVIAAKDLYGPQTTTTTTAQGNVARFGMLLRVRWNFLLVLLAAILAAQLGMGVAAVIWANAVFCKDDSYISTARLLRPVVERLGQNGCAATGRDIANTHTEYLVYGVRRDETATRHHLDLGRDITKTGRFPEGWYDGFEEWVDEDATAVEEVRRKKKGEEEYGRVVMVRRRNMVRGRKRRA
jgi:hypothetical protein